MDDFRGDVYMATVLLERNRWTVEKRPSFRVSDWLERFADAGFDGIELWENHAALCAPEELAALESSALPIAIFSSYAALDDACAAERERVADLAGRLRARRIKFNFGSDPSQAEAYVRNLKEWRTLLPQDCALLCECHPGTIAEEPAGAAELFGLLDGIPVQVIVHAFFLPADRLRESFKCHGRAVTHVHVQVVDEEGARQRLDWDADLVKERLHILREEGFSGSLSLEFTGGTAAPDEDIEALFRNAVADLDFLRDALEEERLTGQ
ncbi:MAG: sugar phosphate isomerase/epimerase [Candidatus Brocadiae bacterium]|nr:sugar phosphate isomerase/epimerase [Candidatus Brocadiia bacterium]